MKGRVKEQVIVALNGKLQGEKKDYDKIIKKGKLLIAADGGANLLERLNYKPDIIIGDLDSLDKEKVTFYKKMGVDIKRYPREKNETDGELALNFCCINKYEDIIVVGSQGGRFDQQLANVFLLEYALIKGLNAKIREPGLEIGIIEKEKLFIDQQGSTLSLIPLSERVKNIHISGFKYGLNGEELIRYKTRGISNLIAEKEAKISSCGEGRLLYVLYGV